ncbi:phage shock protein A [Pullulanibacillus pueri]|uniref:Phage shock protein A n=1 Tax=Pullulanibacillus pueri TaxID=1437324 RepID=A0A8J2ZR39_9BACL|nr:PspA/IM30 family protein [Pullulanibacillus pueri]MBM7679890.1 phage shock protein A [Pullulanibacillus pueri]GGH73340.1 phage shock protein A [Pullulanibacillus pueri]
MGILSRFKTIMSSHISDVLNKSDNPEKIIEDTLRTLNLDLGKVKAETVALMEEEKRIKRALNECRSNIEKMERYAMKAIEAGDENDARAYLEKKAAFASEQSEWETSYQQVASEAAQMKQLLEKLTADIGELEARSQALKMKMTSSETQKKVAGSSATFGQMEDKVDRALFEAEALAELRSNPLDELEDPAEPAKTHKETDVDADLEALKESMKKN